MSPAQGQTICAVEIAVCTVLLMIATVASIWNSRKLRELQTRMDEIADVLAYPEPGKHDDQAGIGGNVRYDSHADDGEVEWTGNVMPYTPSYRSPGEP
jgi:hypothetical protein